MPKIFTETEDGWIKVEEAPEDELDLLIKEIDNIIDKDMFADTYGETKRLPVVPNEATTLKPEEYKSAQKVKEEKSKQKVAKAKADDWDWEKQATKDALWASAIVLGVVGLITGIIALIIWLSPITMDDVASGIAFGIIKAVMWLYEIFYNCVAALCEWIMAKMGAGF